VSATLKGIGATTTTTNGEISAVSFGEVKTAPAAQDLLCLGGLRSLRHIDFYGVPVSAELLGTIASLPLLETLNLNCTSVDDAALKSLQASRTLNALFLMDTAVTNGIGGMLQAFPLRRLRVDGTRLTGTAIRTLLEVHEIQELWLDGAQATPSCMESIARATMLESLTLVGPQVTDKTIAPLANAPSLRNLSVLRASITNEAIRTLAAVEGLQVLGLNGCAGVTDGALFAQHKALQRLWLPETGVTAEGIVFLHTTLPDVTIWPRPA
jgi:hypothetical protein